MMQISTVTPLRLDTGDKMGSDEFKELLMAFV